MKQEVDSQDSVMHIEMNDLLFLKREMTVVNRALVRFHFHITNLANLFTHVPLSPSKTTWFWSKVGDTLRLGKWEGNRGPGVK